jgi:alanyl-tRNA synthetase
VPPSVLRDVEQEVNEVLSADLPVRAEIMSQEQARDAGAMALFGEKYGDEVRVVSVGDWARELCGGTHAQRSGQLGLVKILGESSIGAGVRRVEALVGVDAYRFLAREHALVAQLTDVLKVRPRSCRSRGPADGPAARGREGPRKGPIGTGVGGCGRACGEPDRCVRRGGRDPSVARRHRCGRPAPPRSRRAGPHPSRPAGRRGRDSGRQRAPVVVVAVNDKGREWGIKAGELVRTAAQVLGGGGGGKDDVAQGGGSDPSRVDEALRQIEHVVGQRVTGSD